MPEVYAWNFLVRLGVAELSHETVRSTGGALEAGALEAGALEAGRTLLEAVPMFEADAWSDIIQTRCMEAHI